jgi:hypothetical protein
VSRKSNNLKKRLRQRDMELAAVHKQLLSLQDRVLDLQREVAEEKKRANVRDGIVSIVVKREHERPGQLWAFQVLIDKEAFEYRMWHQPDNYLNQSRFTEQLEIMVVSNLRKLVKDIVYKEI